MRRAVTLSTAALTVTLLMVPVAAALAAPAARTMPRVAPAQVSADPFAKSPSLHSTEVEADTVGTGRSIMSVFQVGRWPNGCADATGWAFSNDGGRTWRHGLLPGLTKSTSPPGPFDRASDPVVTYDAARRQWIAASLDCVGTSAKPGTWAVSPAISVNFSADGLRWSKGLIAARATKGDQLDKEWITCDNSRTSRFFGNCYLEWDRGSDNLVLMSTSRDGGRTWSRSVPNASRLEGIGGEPVVRPDGTVVVPIVGLFGKTARLVDFISADGGRTWSRTIAMTGIYQHKWAADPRGPWFPSVAADQAGRIYVTWPDCRFQPRCGSNDMVLTTSADGRTWTPVARVPALPDPGAGGAAGATGITGAAGVAGTADALGGGIGVDATTSGAQARMAIFYYFYANGKCVVDTCLMYEAYVSSVDGGAHWSAPEVLAGPTRPRQLPYSNGYMSGDYQSVAIIPGGRAVSVFAVGAVPGAQRYNVAMFAPIGGAPVTGGPYPVSSPAPEFLRREVESGDVPAGDAEHRGGALQVR